MAGWFIARRGLSPAWRRCWASSCPRKHTTEGRKRPRDDKDRGENEEEEDFLIECGICYSFSGPNHQLGEEGVALKPLQTKCVLGRPATVCTIVSACWSGCRLCRPHVLHLVPFLVTALTVRNGFPVKTAVN